jgi:hypothetical protein
MSTFGTNWPAPHSDDAAEMGRKLGADLVVYAVIPAGTRLQSVPHVTYQPGQCYRGATYGGGRRRFRMDHFKPTALGGDFANAIHARGGWALHPCSRLSDQKS